LARRRVLVVLVALPAALAVAGCGTETGVSSGATVSVYLSAPLQGAEGGVGRELCASAKGALSQAGGKVGDLQVRLRCLDASGPEGAWTLARVGANARRAVEDSTTVAYIAEPNPKARRQSRPILEGAEIAAVTATSGSVAMRRVLAAIEEADSASLRESVSDSLSGM
jgi:branched-chain amino acid transport system substrate-binding protein